MNTKIKDISIRYLYATAGLFFVALGIALSIYSDLGTAPLSCPAYVLNLKFSGISVGVFTFLFNLLYIIVQLALFRRDFKVTYLLQVVASAILGYLIDANIWLCSFIVWDTMTMKIVASVLACFFTALGISMELEAQAWILSAELTVMAFVHVFRKVQFGTAKIVMDTFLVVISALGAYLFFGNLFGNGEPDGVVISWGTLVLAFLPGFLVKYTDRIIPKIK